MSGRGQLAPGFGVALDVVGQLVEDDVEVAGQLGRAEDADVVGREGLRVGGGRGGEGVAGLQGLDHLVERVFEQLVAWSPR